MLQLSSEVEHARQELDAELQCAAVLRQESEGKLGQLEEEVAGVRLDHTRAEHQRELLEKTAEEQRAELVRLRLSISELELQRESLQFQTSSHEGTISSLKSQVGAY